MKFFPLLVLFAMISVSLSKPVVEIATETFDDFLSFKDYENVVIMFFDPSCPFCQKVKPDYIKAGELASEKLENVVFGIVDLESEYMLGKRNQINFVPSIRLIRKGHEDFIDIKYYSSTEIVNFVFRFFHLHSYELASKEEVANFINNYDSMGLYYGKETYPEFKIFKEYLELHENVQIAFAHIFNEEIIKDLGLQKDHKLAILRKEDEEDFIYFQNEFSLPNLSSFLKRESFPIINKFDQKLMNEMFKSELPLLILLKKPKQKKNEKLDAIFKEVCIEIREKIKCSSIFSDSDYSTPLMDKFGLAETDLPQVFWKKIKS